MPSASDNMTSLRSVETLVIVEIASQFLDLGRYALPYRKSSWWVRQHSVRFLMTSDKYILSDAVRHFLFVRAWCVLFFLLSSRQLLSFAVRCVAEVGARVLCAAGGADGKFKSLLQRIPGHYDQVF